MIIKFIAASSLVLSMSAFAAPEWVTVVASGEGTVLLDLASVTKAGELVNVRVLRNYEQLITLGNDPTTNEMMYPHRSVKLGYLANCESGKLSLESWQMFSGNFGNGETVWADKEHGAPAFMAPSSPEESSALNAACSSRISTNDGKGSRG
jgi:hypothetical protein